MVPKTLGDATPNIHLKNIVAMYWVWYIIPFLQGSYRGGSTARVSPTIFPKGIPNVQAKPAACSLNGPETSIKGRMGNWRVWGGGGGGAW